MQCDDHKTKFRWKFENGTASTLLVIWHLNFWIWLEQVFNTLQTATREAMKPYRIMDADYDLHHNQQKHYFCSNTTLKRWSAEHNAANYIENKTQAINNVNPVFSLWRITMQII